MLFWYTFQVGPCLLLPAALSWCPCHAGATGTGKTVYIKSQINELNTATYQNIQTAFSAQTSANQIQDIIDLKLDKRRKVAISALP